MLKRSFDLVLCLIILPAVIIFFLLISAFSLLFHGRPIFFIQNRIGKNNKEFLLYKFRTMRPPSIEEFSVKYDKQRLTFWGKILRISSLDEVPQIYNILKGDMSIVGPRPLLPKYLPLYSKNQKKRHDVLPGVTGWAQVNGRNRLSWNEKFKMDVWYVENQTLWLDIKIILLTAYKVLAGEGISAKGETTTKEFKGNTD